MGGKKGCYPPKLERLRELFTYDPADGVLRWKVSTRYGIIPGDPVGTLSNGYLRTKVDGLRYYVHNIVWCLTTGEWPHMEIDHRDQNKLNNRWSNLRLATRHQNRWNSPAQHNSKSGAIGVYPKAGRWAAKATTNGVVRYLGTFDTIEEAAAARRRAVATVRGVFAEANND
jgi:hypothetical protein